MKKQASKIIARYYVRGKLIYEEQAYQYIGGQLYRHKHGIKQVLAANPRDRAA